MTRVSSFLLLLLSARSVAQENLTVVYNELYKIVSFEKQKRINDFNRRQILYTNGDSVGLYSFGMQKPDKKTNTVGDKKDHHASFIFPKLGRILGENYWVKPYHLAEYQPAPVDWQLHTDTMRIAGYLCNVAVADGLVAWYAKDIPSSFGPLSYYGLPGLILMLEDHKYMRLYKAASVKLEAPAIVLPGLELKPCQADCVSKLEMIRSYFVH